MTEKVGVKLGTPDRDLVDFYQHIPSFTLGSVEVSPLSMAEAYATFAARGVHCNPIIVSKITNRNGKQLEIPDANCKKVMEPEVADGVSKILKAVIESGTGKRAYVPNGYDQAGKTGTIDSNEAVWFAGYTPEIAGVAMISIDNTKAPFRKRKPGFRRNGVENYTVPSTGVFLEGSGSGDAGAKIWKPVMTEYLKKVPNTAFKQPSRNIQVGKQVRVPSLYGLRIDTATKKLEKAGFTVERRSVYSNSVAGSFLGWSPGPGATVPEFSTVYVNVSRGRDPAVVRAEARARQEAADRARRAAQQREAERRAAAAQRKAAEKKAEDNKKADKGGDKKGG